MTRNLLVIGGTGVVEEVFALPHNAPLRSCDWLRGNHRDHHLNHQRWQRRLLPPQDRMAPVNLEMEAYAQGSKG